MRISIAPMKTEENEYCLLDGEELEIRCWNCGKTKNISEFEFERFSLKNATDFAGWVCRTDFKRKRLLVFCSENCVDSSISSNGEYVRKCS